MKRLKKAKKPFVSFVKSGEGHGFWNVDARVELYTKMLAFFDEHTAPVETAGIVEAPSP